MYQISEENVSFFARKSQKMPFLGLKKPRIGDTMVIHFSHWTQLTRVNRAGAGQGYQIQATRWRELSLLCWSTVVHFQYEYFHYRSVSPKWYRNTYDGRYFLTRLWNVSLKNKERSEIAKFLFLLILLLCTYQIQLRLALADALLERITNVIHKC